MHSRNFLRFSFHETVEDSTLRRGP